MRTDRAMLAAAPLVRLPDSCSCRYKNLAGAGRAVAGAPGRIMSGPLRGIDGIGGLLLDVDGTLLQEEHPVPGAAALIAHLHSAGIPYRITTNITRISRAAIADRLHACGLPVAVDVILNPSVLARRRVIDSGNPRALLLVPETTLIDFDGIRDNASDAAWVIVGDLGREFTRARLDPAFRRLREGATLLALQRGRYWHDPQDGLVLDAGPFVAALEYAAGVTAEVVGKPSLDFFRLALQDLAVPPGETLVVGDDPEADIGGGSRAGCRTALVRTGTYRGRGPRADGLQPDLLIDSVADLI